MSEPTKKGRGKSKKSLELVAAAREVLRENHPATVRAVCYRLFVLGMIPSMAKRHTDAVSNQLKWAREQEMIPWEWIVDETREPERQHTWDNPEDLIEAAVRQYRKDYWAAQPERVEVWSEKGTVRGTLQPVLDEYGVTFRVMHGYTSATSIYSFAQESQRDDRPLTILYVGDFDPSGMHMSAVDLPSRLEKYGGRAKIRRVALTRGDVASGTLPSFGAVTKVKDPRHQWFVSRFGQTCWELDAMPPADLRTRVKERILEHLDADAWDHARKIEAAETESLQHVIGAWRDRLLQQGIFGLAGNYSGGDE